MLLSPRWQQTLIYLPAFFNLSTFCCKYVSTWHIYSSLLFNFCSLMICLSTSCTWDLLFVQLNAYAIQLPVVFSFPSIVSQLVPDENIQLFYSALVPLNMRYSICGWKSRFYFGVLCTAGSTLNLRSLEDNISSSSNKILSLLSTYICAFTS